MKQFSKIAISIISLTCLLFGISSNNYAFANGNGDVDVDWQQQKKSIKDNKNIIEVAEKHKDKIKIAGTYLDEKQILHVILVDKKKSQQELKKLMKISDDVVFEEASNTLEELIKAKKMITNKILKEGNKYSVSSVGIDEVNNSIKVTHTPIPYNSDIKIEQIIETLPKNLQVKVSFHESTSKEVPIRQHALSDDPQTNEYLRKWNPLEMASEIRVRMTSNTRYVQECSIGFGARHKSGVWGIVSAGHCFELPDSDSPQTLRVDQGSEGAHFIGDKVLVKQEYYDYADAAFLQTSAGIQITPNIVDPITDTYWQIGETATSAEFPVGTSVRVHGKKGGTHILKIVDLNDDFFIDNNNDGTPDSTVTYDQVKAIDPNANGNATYSGDSGGPVTDYMEGSDNVFTLYGIIVAGTSDNNTTWFSPWENIRNELGLLDVVTYYIGNKYN
ncbi:trypsin-like serine protease [Bacillus salitolerans]|uniref:Trypsin-like serine protease n=1 Tax=Bacillus salitolerans TaxID=1437434 RepID=A0ABW4LW58_9BACI